MTRRRLHALAAAACAAVALPAAAAGPGCPAITTAAVTASGDDGAGNVPAKTQDGQLETRWSGPGKGAWLQLDLGQVRDVGAASLAWYQGQARQNHFVLTTSQDGAHFDAAYAADSALGTDWQTYRFASRPARYLRVTVNGNTVNDWASITEARACAPDAGPPASDQGPALPRQPYLQGVSGTAAIVALRTSGSCQPFVRYGEGTDVSRIAQAPKADRVHAIRLEGLRPATSYSYVVDACGSVTGVRQFRTASPPTAALRFNAMGDFGTGGSDQAKVVAQLQQASRRGELLLALGDNAYSSGTDAEFQAHMFQPMAPLLRQVPVFPAPGNHEYESAGAQPYLDNFYLPANNPEHSEFYYSFDWGPVHFVSLDSNCAIGLKSSCQKDRQRSWLAQDLAASAQPWKVVFFHHPPWSSGEHGSQLTMRRDYGPLFEQHGVDLVLTGHDHNYERSKPMKGDGVAPAGTRGVVYLVVGSGGASQRTFPGSQPSWTAYRANLIGALDVSVDAGRLSGQLIDTAGKVRDSFTLDKPVRVLPRMLPATDAGTARIDTNAPPVPHSALPVQPADTPEAVADKPDPVLP